MRVSSCQRLFSYSSMIEAIRIFFGYSFLTWRNSSSHTSIGRSEINSMFSNPMTSPEVRERNLPYRGTTLTTFADSRLTVFATAPPQPASNDLAITRAFVPGGPEPSRNGLGKVIPFTTIDRSICLSPHFQLPIANFRFKRGFRRCPVGEFQQRKLSNRQSAIANRQ